MRTVLSFGQKLIFDGVWESLLLKKMLKLHEAQYHAATLARPQATYMGDVRMMIFSKPQRHRSKNSKKMYIGPETFAKLSMVRQFRKGFGPDVHFFRVFTTVPLWLSMQDLGIRRFDILVRICVAFSQNHPSMKHPQPRPAKY